jgi:CRISPR-associated endonuclease Cas1
MDFRKAPAELLDDHDWAGRSEYWRSYRRSTRGAPKKFKYREPLILCGNGVNIRVDHNTLLVRNGFTHYPQKLENTRFFPGDANLPDRIIILDGSGGISFDALNWMAQQNIILVQLNWKGEVNNYGGKIAFCANPKLVEAQRVAKFGNKGSKIAAWLIGNKIEACISVLENQFPKSAIRDLAISRHKRRLSEISQKRNLITIPQLLGIEGDCAQSYFGAWRGLPIKWSGLNKKPIPPNWLEIAPRTKTWRRGPKFAQHPINAMLNYGYGMLIHQVQIQTVAAGLDPAIGIIHGNKSNAVPLVYDLMEPLRPVIDQHILEFALSHTFTPGDFTINNSGGCRLNPQMAKAVSLLGADFSIDRIIGSFLKML